MDQRCVPNNKTESIRSLLYNFEYINATEVSLYNKQ